MDANRQESGSRVSYISLHFILQVGIKRQGQLRVWGFFSLFFFFNPHPRICLLILEREEGRDRDTDMREKHRLVASGSHPNRGSNPQLRYVP